MSSIIISDYNPPSQDYRLISILRNIILDKELKCNETLKELKLKAKKNNLKKELIQIINKEKQINEKLRYYKKELGNNIKIYGKVNFKKVEKEINKLIEDFFEFVDDAESKINKEMKKIKLSKEIEKSFEQIEKSLKETKTVEKRHKEENKITEENLLKISKIKNIPLEVLKTYPKESIKNLLEETNLILNKQKEEKRNTNLYKSYLKIFMKNISNETLKNKIQKTLDKDIINKNEFEELKEEILTLMENETTKKQEEEVKEEVINQLLLKGYIIENENNQILYIDTDDINYKIMMKIKNGKITSKFVKLVDKENYKPSEYERIKDTEKMKKWCSDFEQIKERLKEKGIVIKNKKTIYELEEGINYVYAQEVKKINEEKGNKNAMGKRA